MPAAHEATAASAVAAVDDELAVNGLARQIDLVLNVGVGFHEFPRTVRARGREQGLVALVRRRLGRRAMAVSAVGIASLASGSFRLGLGRPFAEGRGLTFAGADGLVEPPRRIGDLGLKVGDLGLEFGDPLLQDQALRTRLDHAVMLAKGRPVSCACWPGKSEKSEAGQGPLINNKERLLRKC